MSFTQLERSRLLMLREQALSHSIETQVRVPAHAWGHKTLPPMQLNEVLADRCRNGRPNTWRNCWLAASRPLVHSGAAIGCQAHKAWRCMPQSSMSSRQGKL